MDHRVLLTLVNNFNKMIFIIICQTKANVQILIQIPVPVVKIYLFNITIAMVAISHIAFAQQASLTDFSNATQISF